jgi:hypothetical protein
MSRRPLLLAVGGALVISLDACLVDWSGIPSTTSDSVGGAPSTSGDGAADGTTATGGGQTAESSASAGGGGGSGTSSASSSSSSASSSASSSSGGVSVTCDAEYGSVAGYQLCSSPVGLCEFNVHLATTKTCRAVCTQLGGECKATFDNSNTCVYGPPNFGCDSTMFSNAICSCSLGCGGGPPCAASQMCKNGTCSP